MRQMAGVFAQLDRAMTVKRLRDGRRAEAAKGGHASGSYPYGFSKAGPIAHEQRVLEDVRAMREQGYDWQEVADLLNARGVTPRKAKAWTVSNLRKVMD